MTFVLRDNSIITVWLNRDGEWNFQLYGRKDGLPILHGSAPTYCRCAA